MDQGRESPLPQRRGRGLYRTSTRGLMEYEMHELETIRTRYGEATAARTHALETRLRRSKSRLKPFWTFWQDLLDRLDPSVEVDRAEVDVRDPLALERTFLAYLRTSQAFALLGIFVAQLFRLQHAPNPDPVLGYYVVGKPLACICHGAAILTLLFGACHWYRQQAAMLRGKVHSGSFEIKAVGGVVTLILLTFFAILIAIDVRKRD